MRESEVETKLIAYLQSRLAYVGKFDASLVVTRTKAKNKPTKVPRGWSDLAGYDFDGRAWLVEVKTPETWPSGLSLDQAKRLLDASQNFCVPVCTYSVEHCDDVLNKCLTPACRYQQRLQFLTCLPPKFKMPVGRNRYKVTPMSSISLPYLTRAREDIARCKCHECQGAPQQSKAK